MQMRAGLVAIICSTIVTWLLNGLYHGMIAASMLKEAYAPFESVMRPASEMEGAAMFLWMIPLFVMSWFVLRILTQVQGPISISRGAMWGIVTSIVFCGSSEFAWCMMFRYHSLSTSLMNCAFDALVWAIGGSVLAFMYSKLYKAS